MSTMLSLTVTGTPTVVRVPTVIINGSFVFISSMSLTFLVPTTLSNNEALTLKRSQTGGKVSGLPITLPSNESDLVMEGSRLVPMATSPPGLISFLEMPL